MQWLDDLKYALEVWIVFGLLYCLIPKLIFHENDGRSILIRFFGYLARMMLLTAFAVTVLSFFRILNALTLGSFFLSLLFAWAWVVGKKRGLKEWHIRIVAWWEEWYKRRGWRATSQFQKQLKIPATASKEIPTFVAEFIVFLLVAEIRLWWPLQNLRFSNPEAYLQLLSMRELLHHSETFLRPSVPVTVFAVVTSLGAVDAMEVIRFLNPILDLLISVGAGVAAATIFRNKWMGVLTTFVVGCYGETLVTTDESLGIFFLLFGVALLVDSTWKGRSASIYDAMCAFALFVLSLPRTSPWKIALPFLLICALGIVTYSLHRWTPEYHLDALLPVFLLVGLFFFIPPTYPRPHFVEYEATARQTSRMAATLPDLRWTIVAPTEQFSETFGTGHYLDLAQFVDEYGGKVSDPGFRFPYQTLFIFVEKRPFQYFESEPTAVSFSVLTDPTFRSYRSPAGRSSLELATAKLCAVYANLHPSNVYYEDADLKIYQFSRNTFNVKEVVTR